MSENYSVASGMWIGVSLYPSNGAGEAQHLVYPLKMGRAVTEIPIEPRFINGTFELALWGGRLSKKDCATTDQLCQELGYRLYDKRAYVWGQLIQP